MEIEFFREDTKKFLHSLQESSFTKALRAIDLLEEFGHELGMPHSKALSGGMFELRIHDQQEIRLFYTFHNKKAFLLHGYIKKSMKLSLKDLALAKQRKDALVEK